jgi:hypothetical protein
MAKFFGAKFAVKYWQAKHENRECCPQHGALNGISTRLHIARTGFKSWSGKNGLTAAQKTQKTQFSAIFGPGTAEKRLRNGSGNKYA